MAKRNIIFSWSKQRSWIGRSGANGTMSPNLQRIDGIKDKTTSLAYSDGESLEAYETGHKLVGRETTDGTYELTMRIMEPDFALYELLGLASIADGGDSAQVTTHVVDGDWSLHLEPKNVGGIGLNAPVCEIAFKPGRTEEEGRWVDLVFSILQGEQAYWYEEFIKGITPATPTITQTSNSITIACATADTTLQYRIDGGQWQDYSSAITATAENSGKKIEARATNGFTLSDDASAEIAYSA